jgi:hypothetical protein
MFGSFSRSEKEHVSERFGDKLPPLADFRFSRKSRSTPLLEMQLLLLAKDSGVKSRYPPTLDS